MKNRRLPLSWLWIGLAVVAAAEARPRERDVWYAFVADGQRYGQQHVVVSRQSDGNYRYQVRTRMLMNLFGVQKQEIISESEWVVSEAYGPVSVKTRSEMATAKKSMNGRIEDGLLVIRHDGKEERQTTFDLKAGLIPDVCLDDWLMDHADGQTELSVAYIRSDDWCQDTARFERGPVDSEGSVWQMELTGMQARGSVHFDRDCIASETKLEAPKIHLVRCTKDEAEDIDYFVMAGREVLVFPIDHDIGNLARLTELTVRLRWRDIAFDRFDLEDRRQKLLRHDERDGRHEATVRITAPPPLESDRSFPIEDAELAQYLADTHFIKPQHPRIKETAREIVAGKKTALEAVRALAKWVSEYIEGSMPVETLSGPEVLERKTGKCSEYAILFASLARAVGIPTRVALGERMMGDHWGGHMWNEAYVGEWIPVDAGANEVGESFALLKFTHSDTVLGTQGLRWALTESLEIKVEDVKSRLSPLADKYTTGIEGRTYTNIDYACRISAPVESWTLEDSSKAGVTIIRFRIPDRDEVQIHFVVFGLPGGVTPKVINDARIRIFEANYKEFELEPAEARKVGDCEAQMIRFRRAPGGEETGPMKTTEVAWVCGTSGYLLNLIAPVSGHDEFLPGFERLLARFEHLGEE